LPNLVKNIFRTTPVPRLKLWGKVLKRANLNPQGVVSFVATAPDFQNTGTGNSDLTGAINFLNSVPNSKFSLVVAETLDGKLKGSLRTRTGADVSAVAKNFGGGGHKEASGFTLAGRLKNNGKWEVGRWEEELLPVIGKMKAQHQN
jgi:phosphoesterase RecJ-like protein